MGRRQSEPHPERPCVTRYHDAQGRRCKASDPGAAKTTTRSDTYSVRLPNPETGKREWVSLDTKEMGAAWTELDRLLKNRAREAAGLETPLIRHASRPFAEHVAEWAAELRNAGKTGEDTVDLLVYRVGELARLAGWERLPQITRGTALQALATLQTERSPRGMAQRYRGRSARTRNHYTRHLKQFVNWCVSDGRLERNPVEAIEGVNADLDPRHPRRVPTDTEIARLWCYLEGRYHPEPPQDRAGPMPPRRPKRLGRRGEKMTGPHRAIGYRVCMATGYRADELGSLRREAIDLDGATITCRAAHTKNRKLATAHIPVWLVAELREHFAAGGACWAFPRSHPGQVLIQDLAGADVPYETPDGFFDFHSLRHWYLTWAANRPGISPKVLQTLARHSSPELTLKVYAHPIDAEVRRVAQELQRPGTT